MKSAAVLGSTGIIGQTFLRIFSPHPSFQVEPLAASDRSIGRKYGETSLGQASGPIDSKVIDLEPVEPNPKTVGDGDKVPPTPAHPITLSEEVDRPQTRLEVEEENAMTVTTGRTRYDSALDGQKYIVLGNNLLRVGARHSTLNAEHLLSEKITR